MNTIDFTPLFTQDVLGHAHAILPIRCLVTSAHLMISEAPRVGPVWGAAGTQNIRGARGPKDNAAVTR